VQLWGNWPEGGKGLDTHDESRECISTAISEVVAPQAGGRECSVCSETWDTGLRGSQHVHSSMYSLHGLCKHSIIPTISVHTYICIMHMDLHVCIQHVVHNYALAYVSMCRSYLYCGVPVCHLFDCARWLTNENNRIDGRHDACGPMVTQGLLWHLTSRYCDGFDRFRMRRKVPLTSAPHGNQAKPPGKTGRGWWSLDPAISDRHWCVG